MKDRCVTLDSSVAAPDPPMAEDCLEQANISLAMPLDPSTAEDCLEQANISLAMPLDPPTAEDCLEQANISLPMPLDPSMAEDCLDEAVEQVLTLVRAPGTLSGFKGVTKHVGSKVRKSRPFEVQVWKNGRTTRLGYFAKAEEAALCYARHIGADAAAKAQQTESKSERKVQEQALAEGLVLRTKPGTATGFVGVRASNNKRQPLEGQVSEGGKTRRLGYFETAVQAALGHALHRKQSQRNLALESLLTLAEGPSAAVVSTAAVVSESLLTLAEGPSVKQCQASKSLLILAEGPSVKPCEASESLLTLAEGPSVKHCQASKSLLILAEGSPARRRRFTMTPEARQIFDSWLQEHQHPYPTATQKVALARLTQLSSKQINDWFTNYRKRHWHKQESGVKPVGCVEESTPDYVDACSMETDDCV